MSHYKSNVRDLEFNLFEVLDLEKVLATGEFGDLDGDSVREMLAEALDIGRGTGRGVVRRRRPKPADVRPRNPRGDAARVVQEVVAGLAARRVVPHRPRRARRRGARTGDGRLGDQRVRAGRQPGGVHVSGRSELWPTSSTTSATSNSAIGRRWRSTATGAPPWCSPSPTRVPMSAPDAPRRSSSPTARWHIDGVKRFITNGDSDDLFENIMHIVLARPRGRRTGHQGAEPVPGAEVPARSADRRARRAQRCLRHRPRAQDGPEGFGDYAS